MATNSISFMFDPWATTLEAAIANTLTSSTLMVEHLNSELKKRYDSIFESWKTSVLAGKIDNTNPPLPPSGYRLAIGMDGFTYPEMGTQLVTQPRTDIPEDHSKPFVLALPEPDHVRNVPKGDTMPVGYIAVDPQGQRWQKQSSVTPFGVAYFYQRIG